MEPQYKKNITLIRAGSILPQVVPEQKTRKILVVNAKGGCGKTTVATNLVSYYASCKQPAALIDHDPQGSSTQWLLLRSEQRFPIRGIAAYDKPTAGVTRSWQLRMPDGVERLVFDAPAGVHGMSLVDLVRGVDTVIIPVLPSPIDIHAAAHFIKDLLLLAKVRNRSIRVGVLANRVCSRTKVYQSLQRFIGKLQIPLVGQLRDTQNYVRSAEVGLGVHEWSGYTIKKDLEQWEQLIRWVEGETMDGEVIGNGR